MTNAGLLVASGWAHTQGWVEVISYSGVGRSGPGEPTVPLKRKNTPSSTSPLCTMGSPNRKRQGCTIRVT